MHDSEEETPEAGTDLDHSNVSETQHQEATWSSAESQRLARRVSSSMPYGDMTPFSRTGENIAWEDVAFEQFSAEECKKQWLKLLHKVCHYKTTVDIANDIASIEEIPVKSRISKAIAENKKHEKGSKKTDLQEHYPEDFPERVLTSGYSYFSQECLRSNNLPKASSMSVMKLCGEKWRAMSKAEKDVYIQRHIMEKKRYISEVEKYLELHPDNKLAADILARDKHRSTHSKAGPAKASKSGRIQNYFKKSHSMLEDVEEAEESQKKRQRTQPPRSPSKTPKKYDEEVVRSPSKKQRREQQWSEEESQSPSKASPKKSKKKALLTGMDVFIEAKKQDYMLKHPTMEEEDVLMKLQHKYEKTSASKKEKYEGLAAERNG